MDRLIFNFDLGLIVDEIGNEVGYRPFHCLRNFRDGLMFGIFWVKFRYREAEGVFVKGYLRFLIVDSEPVENPENYLVTGTLVDGVLRMTQMGAGGLTGGFESVGALRISEFSFSGRAWSGTYTRNIFFFGN